MKILITGITGMIGKHLADLLVKLGHDVAGISRATSAMRYMRDKADYRHYAGDILDVPFLIRVWTEFKPELVYHLAAQAYNGESWLAEDTTYALNVTGTRNVLNTCKVHSPKARVIPACSSAEYGIVPPEMVPIKEDITPLRPITPYGVSKVCTEIMARQFHCNYNMDVVLPRLFIHVGPDHPPVTAVQNFARQLATIKMGKQKPTVYVGTLDTARDFVDVRDGVKALWLLAAKGVSGEVYNICSGKAYTMRQCLEMLIEISGLEVKVEHDTTLVRLSDEAILLGCTKKLEALDWHAQIPFYQTLKDVYQNWIDRLK